MLIVQYQHAGLQDRTYIIELFNTIYVCLRMRFQSCVCNINIKTLIFTKPGY